MKKDTRQYLIVGKHRHERTSIIRPLTDDHYNNLLKRVGKHSSTGTMIIAIYLLDEVNNE